MKRRTLKIIALGGAFTGGTAIVAWAVGVPSPGMLITLATAGCLIAGLAFGKLESR